MTLLQMATILRHSAALSLTRSGAGQSRFLAFEVTGRIENLELAGGDIVRRFSFLQSQKSQYFNLL